MVANQTPETQEQKEKRAQELRAKLQPSTSVEAGGIAWTEVFTARGSKINLTARADDPITALENLYTAIEYALKVKNCVPEKTYPAAPTAPQAETISASGAVPAPTPAPANQSGIEIIDIKTISHTITQNGVHNVTVKGGMYSKYGVVAWKEILPQDVKDAFEGWPIGQDLAAPVSMRKAMIGTGSNGKGKRVITFSIP